MTGLERNSGVVRLAAYAPLLANTHHAGALCPTNLVIYDNHRCARRDRHLTGPQLLASPACRSAARCTAEQPPDVLLSLSLCLLRL